MSPPGRPAVLGIAGWSGSGKTTLICAVLPVLRAAGLRVSTVKHAHHAVDLDTPGKDSFRHREAGAAEVLLVGGARWALLCETPAGPPPIGELLARLRPADLVLVEGFRAMDFARLEVFRAALGKPPLWPENPGILAVATDAAAGDPALAGCGCKLMDLNAPQAVAGWMAQFARRRTGTA